MKLDVYVITLDNRLVTGWIQQRKRKEPVLYMNTTRVKQDEVIYIRDILAKYEPEYLAFYCPQ